MKMEIDSPPAYLFDFNHMLDESTFVVCNHSLRTEFCALQTANAYSNSKHVTVEHICFFSSKIIIYKCDLTQNEQITVKNLVSSRC